MKIVVTGATGLVGRRLLVELQKGRHHVRALARDKGALPEITPSRVWAWDALSGPPPLEALDSADAVIHLAGDPVASGRWSEQKKARIQASRILGTANLVSALALLPVERRPKILICASATGYYGDTGANQVDETSKSGGGFLAETVIKWEQEVLKAEAICMRVVRMRLGVVLAPEGGALAKMAPVSLGDGGQGLSWIHIEDVLRFISLALTSERVAGAYNLTAPNPVSNRDFTRAYAEARGIPLTAWAPSVALKVVLGEMATETVLASQWVVSARMHEIDFEFKHPEIGAALKDLYQDADYLNEEFRTAQFVPDSVDNVFQFFSRAENLEEITPPWLNFQITKPPEGGVAENALIDYKLKIHGVPVRWRTKIVNWKPKREFVDTQLKGPYSKWHHTHKFYAVDGGTLMTDRVVYRVPGHVLGKTLLGWWIARDVNGIFAYRKKRILEIFSSNKAS